MGILSRLSAGEGRNRKDPSAYSIYYASDIRGSEVCWRKFLKAGEVYDFDAIIFGGDMTGKAIVPVIRTGDWAYEAQFLGEKWRSWGSGLDSEVVKMGAHGSLVAGDGPPFQVPALPVQIVHTAGYGDLYSAGFIVALARGWLSKSAVWFGAAAGALVAQGLESDASIVDFSATAGFLATVGPTFNAIDYPAEVVLAARAPAPARKDRDLD